MTIKIDLFPEIETTTSDLLYTDEAKDLKLRILNTLSGSSIMGIIMEEIEDSFLVGLPCKLMSYGDKRAVEPHMPIRFARFFKYTILTVLPCFGEFEVFYLKWIMDNGRNLYPELITDGYLSSLIKRFNQIKIEVEETKKELESIIEKESSEEEATHPSMIAPPSKTRH